MESQIAGGRYKIVNIIGTGGFGQTYLAQDLHDQRKTFCVVKHFNPKIQDAETRKIAERLFYQEAESLYHLGVHPQIPTLLAHFEENGEFFLVQEYFGGETLEQELKKHGSLIESRCHKIVQELLVVLSFIHQRGVIHRDIKPANLIHRQQNDKMTLIDFGAVRLINDRQPEQVNQKTVAIGSEGFMPPEQIIGQPQLNSDLYALGLVIVHAMTGVHPSLLPKHSQTGEIVWQDKTVVRPQFAAFIEAMIRRDFRNRFFSASEALKALNLMNLKYFQEANFAPQFAMQSVAQSNNREFQKSPEIRQTPLNTGIPQVLQTVGNPSNMSNAPMMAENPPFQPQPKVINGNQTNLTKMPVFAEAPPPQVPPQFAQRSTANFAPTFQHPTAFLPRQPVNNHPNQRSSDFLLNNFSDDVPGFRAFAIAGKIMLGLFLLLVLLGCLMQC